MLGVLILLPPAHICFYQTTFRSNRSDARATRGAEPCLPSSIDLRSLGITFGDGLISRTFVFSVGLSLFRNVRLSSSSPFRWASSKDRFLLLEISNLIDSPDEMGPGRTTPPFVAGSRRYVPI